MARWGSISRPIPPASVHHRLHRIGGFSTTVNAPQPLWGRGIDIFVTKLQRGRAGLSGLQWSTYAGGKGSNSGLALVVGPTEPCTWPAMREASFRRARTRPRARSMAVLAMVSILVVSQP